MHNLVFISCKPNQMVVLLLIIDIMNFESTYYCIEAPSQLANCQLKQSMSSFGGMRCKPLNVSISEEAFNCQTPIHIRSAYAVIP